MPEVLQGWENVEQVFFPFVGVEDKYVVVEGQIVKVDTDNKDKSRVDLT